MLQLPRDVLLHLFLFLNLDDWCHYRQLSQEHAIATQRLGGFVQGVIRDRMLRFLMTLLGEVTFHKFMLALATSKAVVSGSIFIELLLGSDQFTCSDVDVYVPLGIGSFGDVHKCMYEDITGCEWKRGAKPSGDAQMHLSAWSWLTSSGWGSEHMQSITTTQHYNNMITVNTDPWISQLWSYVPQHSVYVHQDSVSIPIQVIGIRSLKYRKWIERRVTCGLANYFIDQCFDFTCCLGKMMVEKTKDGSLIASFVLPPVADLNRRLLVTRPVFEHRMSFASPGMLQRYKEHRVKKYQERMFVLTSNISRFGCNYNKLKKMKLDKNRKYSIDQIDLMCEGKRKPRKRRKIN